MNPIQFLIIFLTCVFFFLVFTLMFIEYVKWRFRTSPKMVGNIIVTVIASVAYITITARLAFLFLFGA